MSKAKTVAWLLTGAVAGLGGRIVVDGLGPGTAEAARPYVHAVDLRRAYGQLQVTAYAQIPADAGQARDLGVAKECKLTPLTTKLTDELLYVLGSECVWP